MDQKPENIAEKAMILHIWGPGKLEALDLSRSQRSVLRTVGATKLPILWSHVPNIIVSHTSSISQNHIGNYLGTHARESAMKARSLSGQRTNRNAYTRPQSQRQLNVGWRLGC